MTSSDQSFANRFRKMFEGGLEDIKLFLRPDRPRPTGPTLRAELDRMQDAIGAKKETRIYSIDGDIPQVRYDAPFS
jgi:hypothetical protein